MSDIKLLKEMKEKAKLRKRRIVLPESHDERVLKAAEILSKEKIADVITIGNEEKIKSDAENLGVDLSGVEIVDPQNSELADGFSEVFYNARKHKGITFEDFISECKKIIIENNLL